MTKSTIPTLTIEELSTDYNWKAVFGFAGYAEGDYGNAGGEQAYRARPDGDREPLDIHPEWVTGIYSWYEGEHDERDWEIVFRFEHPERGVLFGYITAGCDYTGWDCQASGFAFWAPTLEEINRFAIGDTSRLRTEGLPLPIAPVAD